MNDNNRIIWKYDKKNKEWYTHLTDAGGTSEAWSIKNEPLYHYSKYKLTRGHFNVIGRFKKLDSAKKVVELLING